MHFIGDILGGLGKIGLSAGLSGGFSLPGMFAQGVVPGSDAALAQTAMMSM